MTTTNNITTSTINMNIYNNTEQTIDPNMYIPTKVCKICRTIKKVTEFYKCKTIRDGYLNKCIDCVNNLRRDDVNENKDKIVKQQKEYHEKNKIIESEQRKKYY